MSEERTVAENVSRKICARRKCHSFAFMRALSACEQTILAIRHRKPLSAETNFSLGMLNPLKANLTASLPKELLHLFQIIVRLLTSQNIPMVQVGGAT